MALATAPLTRALTDIIEEGLALALDGQPVAEVARELWERNGSMTLAHEVAPLGIAQLIHARLSALRGPSHEGTGEVEVVVVGDSQDGLARLPRDGRAAVRRPMAATVSWAGVLAGNYEVAADGSRKPIYDFTKDDAIFVRDMARGREAGFRKLADAMELAASLLTGERTIADLPARKQRAIEAALS